MVFLELRKKGIHPYVSHVLVLAIFLVILALISSFLYDYYIETVKKSERSGAEVVGEKVGSEVLLLYSKYKHSGQFPSSSPNITLGKVTLNLPNQIAERDYRLELNPSNLSVQLLEFPRRTFTFSLYEIEANLSGTVKMPKQVELKYVREGNKSSYMDHIFLSSGKDEVK